MELNGPGASLFQGNDLNNFNNLAQREEEEEALEEQKRRDLELKNMLENAFDDVSFDNDEGSICNGSQNYSSSSHSAFHSNSHNELDPMFKPTSQNKVISDLNQSFPSNSVDSFNTSLKHFGKNNQIKRVDFNNDTESYSDQCRKKIQNGSLHDVVDASGGGDIQSSLHYNHCFQSSPLGEVVCNGLPSNSNEKIVKQQYSDTAHDSSEQLKILYDVRVREVHRLTELIDSMRNEHELQIKEMKHQLALMLAEKERANISQTQLQSLLVESKQEAEELANDLKALEKSHKELEISKNELLMELTNAKLTIDDLQRKVIILEKGSKSRSEAMQYELNLKALSEKHSLELLSLKNELDNYIRKFEASSKENEDLKLRISNLGLINEENLAKKSEIISRLSKQIDETQAQCENLMKSSNSEEMLRLQMELKMLKEEKTLLALKLENLEKENTRQEEELQQYESISKISAFGDSSNPKELENSMNTKLQGELFRALSGLKTKRLEIKSLQAQLEDKNEKLVAMTENETILRNEVAKYKDEANEHLSKLKNQEDLLLVKEEEITKLLQEVKELNSAKDSKNTLQQNLEDLMKENKSLKDRVNELEKEKSEAMNVYNEEYLRFHNEGLEKAKEETARQYKLEFLKKDFEIEEMKKEIEELKNLYIEVFNSKENLLAQLEKEKESSGRNSAVDMEEVKKLQKDLEKSRHRILELDQTLKQQYQQEVEILNLEINQLNLQVEKIKKEKDIEVAEKDKVLIENEMLKAEIEQITSEKNLLFLDNEKVEKEIEELKRNFQKVKESSKEQLCELVENHEQELKALTSKYDLIIKKLKKELEMTVSKSVKESKYTSPIKINTNCRSISTQGSCVLEDKATSPAKLVYTAESSTSPMSDLKKNHRRSLKEPLTLRDISVLTDPEPVKIPKKEVLEIMEKLGAHHEEEMRSLENKYRMELVKLDKKFQVEVDKAKEIIRKELHKEYLLELEKMEKKHRIELENRIEDEKKEAVVDLITEWACEVQSLKVSYAEAQAKMERMKMKYQAAKSVALQYKTYFKSKAEYMKEEWKRIEDGYERALKELEKNVHILVDVKEDEVKEKVETITKIYEQKINKMKEKLSKCEDRLKAESSDKKRTKAQHFDFRKEIEQLSVPETNLCSSSKKKNELLHELKRRREGERMSESQKRSGRNSKEESSDKERTSR